MFRLFVVMYGLSLTDAYTIKLSGTVELGKQLSKVFNEVYSQLAENGYIPDQMSGMQTEIRSPNEQGFDTGSPHNGENDEEKSEEKGKKQNAKKLKDMPILDNMMKNDLEKLHLYGLHKFEEKSNNDGKPLNNIHI